jgi:glycine oxidase
MAEESSRATDVLIIGGGIIGCSIALRLKQGGMSVIVLDRGEPGAEASSAAAGMLAPQGEMIEPRTFSDLCVTSRNLYPQFAAEIEKLSGQHVAYRSDGSLLVALGEKQETELTEVYRQQTARGFSLQRLTAAEVHRHVAGLSPQIRSGLFIAGDHWVDSERLMRALLVACRHEGVRIEAGRTVRRFKATDDRIERLEAGSDTASHTATYTAKTYILAAGCWSGELAALLGINLPLVPCRGQMMEFETPRELPWVVRAGLHYLVPRPEQRLLVGTTAEYVGYDKAVTGEGLRSVLQGAMNLAPFVAGLRFRRAWAGLRPDSTDHLPILGYGRFENLVFSTGHFRNGILLAPVTAEIIAELVLKGSASRPMESYRTTRFSRPAGEPLPWHRTR